jgi:hypothetical protein
MRKLLAALLLLAIAAPTLADFRQTPSVLTFFLQASTARMTELRDALLWRSDRRALDGLMATSARTNIVLSDLGGGQSELSIAMPRAAGDTWTANLAAARNCVATTTVQRLDCANTAIREDMLQTLREYRASLITPPAEPTLP